MIDIYADLETAGFPVYQQGAAPAILEESFLTVWQDDSADILNADNKPVQCRHEWSVIFYTRDKKQIFDGLRAVIDALKKRGYLISGQGYDAAGSWEGYDARAVDVLKIEELEG